MDYADAVKLCDRVITGISIIEDRGNIYHVRDPISLDRHIANLRYQEVIEELEMSDVNSQQLSHKILAKKNIWNEAKEKELLDIENRRNYLRKELLQLEFQSQKKRMVIKELNNLDVASKLLLNQKNALSTNTIEYLAHVEKYKKLVFLLTYDGDKKLWNDWGQFLKEDDVLINKIMNEAFFNPDLSEVKLRWLAHNEPWRSTWVIAKKVGNLFNKPISHMTDYQKILCSWSLVYDSVYDHPDCPPDNVISDDTQLDMWLLTQSEKRKNQSTANEVNKMISNNPRINNAQEVGIVVDSIEDAKRVYNLNDESTKSSLRRRDDKIKSEGSVLEINRPDVRLDLRMQANQMAQERHKQ